MLTTLLTTLISAALGGAGLWIVALFFPSVALLLKSALDFLRSPLGLIVAVVLAGLVLFCSGYVGGDMHGTNTTRAAWRADNIAKKAAADRLIAENKTRAAADADARISAINAFAKTLDEKVKRYESETADRAGMRLNADDVRGMRNGFR